MTKIVHLTDTHLRAPGETVIGLDPAERLRTAIASINQYHADADLCVITGDLADQGEPEAYRLLREILAGLRLPIRLLLGNHDARKPFFDAFPFSLRDEHGFVQSTTVIGDIACIFLDTLNEAHPGQGLLCPDRLAWLEAELHHFSDLATLLFMHHPPLSIGLPWFDSMLLANGHEFMDRVAFAPNLRHFVCGHVHVNASGSWRGVSFSASRGTCHKILANGSAERADYADHGAAYDVLHLSADAVCVHSVDPAGPTELIACEHPTEDGKGMFQLFERGGTWC